MVCILMCPVVSSIVMHPSNVITVSSATTTVRTKFDVHFRQPFVASFESSAKQLSSISLKCWVSFVFEARCVCMCGMPPSVQVYDRVVRSFLHADLCPGAFEPVRGSRSLIYSLLKKPEGGPVLTPAQVAAGCTQSWSVATLGRHVVS